MSAEFDLSKGAFSESFAYKSNIRLRLVLTDEEIPDLIRFLLFLLFLQIDDLTGAGISDNFGRGSWLLHPTLSGFILRSH